MNPFNDIGVDGKLPTTIPKQIRNELDLFRKEGGTVQYCLNYFDSYPCLLGKKVSVSASNYSSGHRFLNGYFCKVIGYPLSQKQIIKEINGQTVGLKAAKIVGDDVIFATKHILIQEDGQQLMLAMITRPDAIDLHTLLKKMNFEETVICFADILPDLVNKVYQMTSVYTNGDLKADNVIVFSENGKWKVAFCDTSMFYSFMNTPQDHPTGVITGSAPFPRALMCIYYCEVYGYNNWNYESYQEVERLCSYMFGSTHKAYAHYIISTMQEKTKNELHRAILKKPYCKTKKQVIRRIMEYFEISIPGGNFDMLYNSLEEDLSLPIQLLNQIRPKWRIENDLYSVAMLIVYEIYLKNIDLDRLYSALKIENPVSADILSHFCEMVHEEGNICEKEKWGWGVIDKFPICDIQPVVIQDKQKKKKKMCKHFCVIQ